MIKAELKTGKKLLAALFAVLLVAGLAAAWSGPAFAEEESAALDVYYDDTCLKSFTMSELEDIAKAEGSKSYTFSAYNTYPTPKLSAEVEGPTVEGILSQALAADGRQLSDIAADQRIEFRAGDGLKETFLKETLLGERFYYPNFRNELGRAGQAVLAESMTDPVQVPAVISLREKGKAYAAGANDDVGRLLFGQLAANEQNHSMFVKYLATGDKAAAGMRGRITIRSGAADTLQAIRTTDHGKSGGAKAGQSIIFDRSVNRSHTEGGSRYWIYYTLDGTEPDQTSQMYNYNNNSFGQSDEKINFPVIGTEDITQIRVKVYAYDKLPSQASEFTFCKAPAKPGMKKLSRKGKSVTVKWKEAARAEGYQIVRALKKSGKYKTVKTVKNGKTLYWKNTGLKKGKTYYYKVRAFRTIAGKKVYSSYSAVKYIKVK